MPKGIFIRTPEMYKTRKGKNYFLGKHHTEKSKQQIRDKLKNRKRPPFTAKWKKNISKAHLGQIPWNKNRKGLQKHSTEAKVKMSKAKLEEKHWNWKGGITSASSQIRGSIQYKQWRQNVFIRDDFTCRKCGDNTGNNLEAHHIKPLHKLLEDVKKYLPLLNLYKGAMIYSPLWNLDNGITLCEKCHKKIHPHIKENICRTDELL